MSEGDVSMFYVTSFSRLDVITIGRLILIKDFQTFQHGVNLIRNT